MVSTAESASRTNIQDLYQDHHGWLQAWLRRRLGSAADAADLAHDTFVRLLGGRRQQRFDSGAQARAYLRTTARNLCINLWRRQEIERAWLDKFTAHGYVDTFRLVRGDEPEWYSWWSYRMRARERNVGWRIDYFFVSEELKSAVRDAWIETDVYGSDHCPVGLELEI